MTHHPQRDFSQLLALGSLFAVTFAFAAEQPAAKPAIRVITDKANLPIAFEATGLAASDLARLADREDRDEALAKVLSVFVAGAAQDFDLPAMAGKHSVDGTSLRFAPRYPLRAGMRYRAVLRPAAATKSVTLEVTVPEAAAGKPTEIAHVYPTSATLPENQLKFYIHFSAPMGRGEAYEHLRLLDAKGQKADLPFLELNEELWDASGTRLTLFIDPGRIKRGVKPREDLGPVLEAGREYTLVIDRGWRDATGRPLKSDFQKRFRTTAPVETAIDEKAWKIVPPAHDSKEPLFVKFPRPLDHALVERTLWVTGPDGISIAGNGKAADEERRWEFRPERPWSAGKYQLVVETTLEDLAGNRIGQPFEVEILGTEETRAPDETVKLPFTIGP